jgi:hypothetical protein
LLAALGTALASAQEERKTGKPRVGHHALSSSWTDRLAGVVERME